MKRRELMTNVSLAAGLSLGMSTMITPVIAGKSAAVEHADPLGFLKSGNPFNAY